MLISPAMEGRAVVIRPALTTEAKELAELAARTYRDTFASVNTPENMNAYLSEAFSVEQIAKEQKDTRSTFLIAEVNGEKLVTVSNF